MLAWTQVSPPAMAVDYVRDVKPILQKHCYDCHSALRQNSGLRLDHVTFIRQGGDRGSAIADDGGRSLLIRAVSGGDDGNRNGMERMPRDAKPLTDEQIATLTAWIDAGAPAPDEKVPDDPRKHWSFRKPVRPPLPPVPMASGAAQAADWSKHPIDRFLAAEHRSRGLVPADPAAKNVLLRRVYVDLIGLPPSPVELRKFLADQSPDAYERVVDNLLDSPQYGERWGRHWMDVWRYSDWDGFGADAVFESKPHIWRWRDWIIESLNSDRPYDQMVSEMLAADEIAPLDEAAGRAGGFLARNWHKANRNVWMEATVEHVAKAYLAITLNCARCHDHKYDPILQTEYYQFRAFFEPYDVRADPVPGQVDVKRDALVRVYDAHVNQPTFLFVRGNEAKPDKTHPLVSAVPRALGGDALRIEPVALPPTAYSPGLRPFVQGDLIAHAQAEVDRLDSAAADVNASLADARQKLANLAVAQSQRDTPQVSVAAQPAPAPSNRGAAANEASLQAAVTEAEQAVVLIEHEMRAAWANLVAVQAAIAAEKAARATPPADNARQLAREARRAQRVSDVDQTRYTVMRLDHEVAAAEADALKDDAAQKKVVELKFQLVEANKARIAAEVELGQASQPYNRFGQDFRCAAAAPGANDKPCTQLGEIYPTTSTGRRAALARWIASKNNPLTARVAINHIWMRHFGSPLVPTVFDFGLSGKPPSHPALLDWLAVELMDQGWKMKAIHHLIVTSSAYRMQSTSDNESNHSRDPENVFLWRMNPRRMEAEVVRDSTLHVADALDLTMFGPELDENQDLTVLRRSIYFRSSKEKKVAFLELFDGPSVTDCYRRSETVVPQQALAMANSALTLAATRRLAGSLAMELNAQATPASLSAFIAASFERVLCRQPSRLEAAACLDFLQTQSRELADPQARVTFPSGGENPVKPSADPVQRARENLVHVLLNHNDFLTVR